MSNPIRIHPGRAIAYGLIVWVMALLYWWSLRGCGFALLVALMILVSMEGE